MLDRPVINIAFDGRQLLPYQKSARRCLDFVHMAKLLAMGGIRVAKSFAELERCINTYLCNPELDHDARMLSAREGMRVYRWAIGRACCQRIVTVSRTGH